MPLWQRGLWLALTLGALAFGGLVARVEGFERGELAHEGRAKSLSQWAEAKGSTAVSARLASIELRRGEHAIFELCAEDPLRGREWQGAFDLAVLGWPGPTLLLRVPLDAEHLALAKRSAREACLPLGSGAIERDGRYTLDVVWPERAVPDALREVPLRARILARRLLAPIDRGLVVLLLTAIALALASLALAPRYAPRPLQLPHPRAWLRAQALLLLLALASFAPLYGSTLGLLKGGMLAAIQIVGALLVIERDVPRRAALALQRPARLPLYLAIAVAAALLLSQAARFALRIVPSSGVSPIETFISWPSGTLAFASLGVLLPVGEELFFRGYVYGVLEPLGRGRAIVLTWLAFVLLHVPQSWGNWGGLLAIALTGLVLTILRERSGSVLVPLLAHVLYNGALSLGSL